MSNKNQTKSSRAQTPRVSTQQKKVRRQQVFLAVIGIVVILAMVLALVVNY
jgi:predicted nucleic acid-binding Zn ribbon protein